MGNRECNCHYQTILERDDEVIKQDMLCAGSEGHDSCQVRPRAARPRPPSPSSPRAWDLPAPRPQGHGSSS